MKLNIYEISLKLESAAFSVTDDFANVFLSVDGIEESLYFNFLDYHLSESEGDNALLRGLIEKRFAIKIDDLSRELVQELRSKLSGVLNKAWSELCFDNFDAKPNKKKR